MSNTTISELEEEFEALEVDEEEAEKIKTHQNSDFGPEDDHNFYGIPYQ